MQKSFAGLPYELCLEQSLIFNMEKSNHVSKIIWEIGKCNFGNSSESILAKLIESNRVL